MVRMQAAAAGTYICTTIQRVERPNAAAHQSHCYVPKEARVTLNGFRAGCPPPLYSTLVAGLRSPRPSPKT